jgi:hypothetical protein
MTSLEEPATQIALDSQTQTTNWYMAQLPVTAVPLHGSAAAHLMLPLGLAALD